MCKQPHSTRKQKKLGFHSTICLPFQNLNRAQSGGREQMEGLEFGSECEVRLTKHRGITTGSIHRVWVYGQIKWLTVSQKPVPSLKDSSTNFTQIPSWVISFCIYTQKGGNTMMDSVHGLFENSCYGLRLLWRMDVCKMCKQCLSLYLYPNILISILGFKPEMDRACSCFVFKENKLHNTWLSLTSYFCLCLLTIFSNIFYFPKCNKTCSLI